MFKDRQDFEDKLSKSLEKAWLKPGQESQASMHNKEVHPLSQDYNKPKGGASKDSEQDSSDHIVHGDLSAKYVGDLGDRGGHTYHIHHKNKEVGIIQADHNGDIGGGGKPINGEHMMDHKDYSDLQDKMEAHAKKKGWKPFVP